MGFFGRDSIGVLQRTKVFSQVPQKFSVQFPLWNRSPWGMAWHLRGPGELLMDTVDDEEWVAEFLDYLVRARKHWETERAKFLKTAVSIGNIYNDEVLSPFLSPSMYEELIRPGEIELSNFLGGINYWHSCGNTTPFQKLIDGIPNVHMVHVSPWSNISSAVKAYDTENKALEIALYGYEELLRAPGKKHIIDKVYVHVFIRFRYMPLAICKEFQCFDICHVLSLQY